MDNFLAQAIIDLQVPFFGKSLKNKGDSRSCLFRPRHLLSDPKVLKHLGKRMAQIALEECRAKTLIGMATSGIAFATVASLYSGLPMMYVRKKLEEHMSNQLIEGIPPEDKKVVLVDDLLFAGESKQEALEILKNHGYEVTDIIVAIDRQLERKKDGPRVQDKWNLDLHSLITMSEIVAYMQEKQVITAEQLQNLRQDYRRFDRWDQADFAKD